jgi:xanthine dehydrogenase YagS FAD-binding subunit
VLTQGELITHLDLFDLPDGVSSAYLKVRDRASYEFALTSAAVVLGVSGPAISTARVALGGVATVPWRSREAENVLLGGAPTAELFRRAAAAAFADAHPLSDNGFKVELGQRTLVRALTNLATRSAS